jgi:hypothetical protein
LIHKGDTTYLPLSPSILPDNCGLVHNLFGDNKLISLYLPLSPSFSLSSLVSYNLSPQVNLVFLICQFISPNVRRFISLVYKTYLPSIPHCKHNFGVVMLSKAEEVLLAAGSTCQEEWCRDVPGVIIRIIILID